MQQLLQLRFASRRGRGLERADYLATGSRRSRRARTLARPVGGRVLLLCGFAFVLCGFAFALRRPIRIAVSGDSMLATLEDGDRLLVIRGGSVRAGDIIALRDPQEDGRLLVKRAI